MLCQVGSGRLVFGENINSLMEDSSLMLFKLVTGNLGFNLWFSIKKKFRRSLEGPQKIGLLETQWQAADFFLNMAFSSLANFLFHNTKYQHLVQFFQLSFNNTLIKSMNYKVTAANRNLNISLANTEQNRLRFYNEKKFV